MCLMVMYPYKGNFLISYFGEVMIFVTFALLLKTVVVAQLVRASDCDSEGRGFEPPRLPQKDFRFTSGNLFLSKPGKN